MLVNAVTFAETFAPVYRDEKKPSKHEWFLSGGESGILIAQKVKIATVNRRRKDDSRNNTRIIIFN